MIAVVDRFAKVAIQKGMLIITLPNGAELHYGSEDSKLKVKSKGWRPVIKHVNVVNKAELSITCRCF